jgi:hypothetical protein
MALDEIVRTFRQCICQIRRIGDRRLVVKEIVPAKFTRTVVVVDVAAEKAPELIEAVPTGMKLAIPSQVPLSDQPRRVSTSFQECGQGVSGRQYANRGVGREGAEWIFDAKPLLVTTRDEARPRR